jgi:hypothetical protein
MNHNTKYFRYVGQHCSKPCLISQSGKICQCKYDRKYERQSFERPDLDPPKIKIPSDAELEEAQIRLVRKTGA